MFRTLSLGGPSLFLRHGMGVMLIIAVSLLGSFVSDFINRPGIIHGIVGAAMLAYCLGVVCVRTVRYDLGVRCSVNQLLST